MLWDIVTGKLFVYIIRCEADSCTSYATNLIASDHHPDPMRQAPNPKQPNFC